MNTRTLFHLPYQVGRTPLTLLDAGLFQRLPDDSAPRLAFERVLGSLDEVAGRLLDDEDIERRGAELRARADKLGEAVQLEQAAADDRQAVAETIQEGRQEADTLRQDAERQRHDGLQDAAANESEHKQAATRRARTQADAAKRQADARAAAKLDSVAEQRRQTEARVSASEREATEEPKTALREAAERKTAARGRRSEADQLGTLADQKQQVRKAR